MPDLDSAAGGEALLAIAMAIADGTPVDWSEGLSADVSASALTARLRWLEEVVRGHQSLRADSDDSRRIEGAHAHGQETVLTETRRQLSLQASDPVTVEWGPLVVLEKVARGSFGDVYRAWDPRLERQVALKLVPEDDGSAPSPVVEEGRLLARVRHPNVLTIHGAERVDGRSGIWTEYLPGDTLAKEVERRGPLDAAEAARIGIDVSRALGAVHAAGLLHRDVKAQNVMRDETGRIVLADFGTGIQLDERRDVGERQLAGTPLFLAPEVFENRTPSVESDLYSLGVLMYFLVTGDYPVRGRTLAEIRAAHWNRRRVPLAQERAGLPRRFVAIVERLLAVDPQRRFADADSVAYALERWLRRRRQAGAALFLAGASVILISLGIAASRWYAGEQISLVDGAPTTRQIIDPPCFGAPSRDGSIACVETTSHARARGEQGEPPVVLFNPYTGEQRVIWRPSSGRRVESTIISPRADRIAWVSSARDVPSEIHVLELAIRRDQLIMSLPPYVRTLQLAEWRQVDDQITARLWRADGSQALVLLSPRVGSLDVVFEFPTTPQGFATSPDRRLIAFDAPQTADGPERDIRICDLTTRACGVIAPHPANDFFPFWTPDGRLMFDSDRAGPMGLWVVEVDNLRAVAEPTLIRDTGRARLDPAGFTADGVLFYALRTGEFDVYSASFDHDSGTASTPVRLSPRLVDTNKSPAWSADGRWLAYVSRRGPFVERGSMRIVVQSTDDQREREFPYDIRMNMSRLAWSPDNRALALRTLRDGVAPAGVFGIHLIDPADGRIVKTLSRQDAAEESVYDQIGDIAWLDQRTIAFASRGGVGSFDVSTGLERTLWRAPPDAQVDSLAVSPDRLALALTVSEQSRQWTALDIVPSAGGTATQLLRVNQPDLLWAQAWAADGRGVFVTRPDSPRSSTSAAQQRLWLIPVDGSAPRALTLAVPGLGEVRVHPDGVRLAFTAGGNQPDYWTMSILSH